LADLPVQQHGAAGRRRRGDRLPRPPRRDDRAAGQARAEHAVVPRRDAGRRLRAEARRPPDRADHARRCARRDRLRAAAARRGGLRRRLLLSRRAEGPRPDPGADQRRARARGSRLRRAGLREGRPRARRARLSAASPAPDPAVRLLGEIALLVLAVAIVLAIGRGLAPVAPGIAAALRALLHPLVLLALAAIFL